MISPVMNTVAISTLIQTSNKHRGELSCSRDTHGPFLEIKIKHVGVNLKFLCDYLTTGCMFVKKKKGAKRGKISKKNRFQQHNRYTKVKTPSAYSIPLYLRGLVN